MATIGRPTKPHKTRQGKTIDGLYHRPDGRWLNRRTGKIWTQTDEVLAVAEFMRQEEGINTLTMQGRPALPDLTWGNHLYAHSSSVMEPVIVDSGEFWRFVRDCLINRPGYVAERVGLPRLANHHDFALPGKKVVINDLLEMYIANAGIGKLSQRHTRRMVKHFLKNSGWTALSDFQTEGLIAYRDLIKKSGWNPATIKSWFGKIKTVIAHSRKEGIDVIQVRTALDQLAVLTVKSSGKTLDPTPISPEDFNAILAGATPELRALLLLALNGCMYLSEVLAVEWGEIDFKKGTFASHRSKTGVRRAATLWPETAAALKAHPVRGESPYVFTSSHGTKYNSSSYGAKFARYREATGVSTDVEFNNLRDGAYSASCASGIALTLCRALAGHRLDGETDHYLARNPALVKPACDAVYATYAPFPKSVGAVRVGGRGGRPRKHKLVAAV